MQKFWDFLSVTRESDPLAPRNEQLALKGVPGIPQQSVPLDCRRSLYSKSFAGQDGAVGGSGAICGAVFPRKKTEIAGGDAGERSSMLTLPASFLA